MRLSDYISRSEARAAIAAARDRRIADKPYGWEWEYNGFNAAIMALPMPTEDLAPVVRCRECKNWHTNYLPLNGTHGCDVVMDFTAPEDFCSWAVRKAGDGDDHV